MLIGASVYNLICLNQSQAPPGLKKKNSCCHELVRQLGPCACHYGFLAKAIETAIDLIN